MNGGGGETNYEWMRRWTKRRRSKLQIKEKEEEEKKYRFRRRKGNKL